MLRAVTVSITAGVPTRVNIDLAASKLEDVVLDGAEIYVAGVAMPASVEMALYQHLFRKHGFNELDVTPLNNDNEREFAVKSLFSDPSLLVYPTST